MPARGLLCRLAAASTSTSTATTFNLAPIARAHAHALQRSLLARNVSSAVLLRAARRAYATATTAARTKPTAKVVKDVKKQAAAKPSTTRAKAKPAATKKPVKKSPATKKKKKAVAKKPAAKPKKAKKKKKVVKPKKPARKVLTPEQKERIIAKKQVESIRALKKVALRDPTTTRVLTAYNAFLKEQMQNTNLSGKFALKDIAPKFKEITPAQREHYNHLANEHTAKARAEYEAWVRSHTPAEIRAANNARLALRRKKVTGFAKVKLIQDDRAPPRPVTAYAMFNKARQASGDFKGITIIQSSPLVSAEWKALSAAEKKTYEDQAKASSAIYEKEYEKIFGEPPKYTVKARSASPASST